MNAGLRLLGRELALGLVHGIVLALVAGGIGYVWKGSIGLAMVLGYGNGREFTGSSASPEPACR